MRNELYRPGDKPVPGQKGCLRPETLQCALGTPSLYALIQDIIMNQGSGMNQLHGQSGIGWLFGSAAMGLCREDENEGTDPLSRSREHITNDLS